MNPGVAISLHAALEPQYVIAEQCLVTRDASILRIVIEIDATGNRMTGTGGGNCRPVTTKLSRVFPMKAPVIA